MKRLLAALVGLFLLLGWLLASSRRDSDRPRAPARLAPNGVSKAPAIGNARAGLAGPLIATSERRSRSSPVAVGEGSEPRKCVVLGRILDLQDAPIVGAKVQLASAGLWAEGVDVPYLPGLFGYRGFEVSSDAAGAFRIEAPPPSVSHTWLDIRPDPPYDYAHFLFDSEAPDALPSLGEGIRDLGVIHLARTGVVYGHVLSLEGRPLQGARIHLAREESRPLDRFAISEQDGAYRIERALIGTFGLVAECDGYLTAFVSPFAVEEGAQVGPIDLVLTPAPTIEGVILDEEGRPLEGARVSGVPVGGGWAAAAHSDADGRFRLFLPQEQPHIVNVECTGFARWGSEEGPKVAARTKDLRVVLQATPKIRFLVVDASTGNPVEDFGLTILEQNGSKAPDLRFDERVPPPIRHHPGGASEAHALPGVDLFLVSAKGYPLAQGDVALDESAPPTQTIHLETGHTIKGRVLLRGEPAVGAVVQLTPGYMRNGGLRKLTGAGKGNCSEFVVHLESEPARQTTTDEEGRFEFHRVEGGDYKITAQFSGGLRLQEVVEDVWIQETRDVGDLMLLPSAAIEGRVLFPPGVEPEGFDIFLDGWGHRLSTRTDAEGRFEFRELPAGYHRLETGWREGELAPCEPQVVRLEAGEAKPVTIDATDRRMCSIELALRLDPVPLESICVDVENPLDEGELGFLGCNASGGHLRGAVRAWGESVLRIRSADGRASLRLADVLPDLTPGGSVSASVDIPFTRVLIHLPVDLDPDLFNRGELTLETADGPFPCYSLESHFDGKSLEETAFVGGEAGSMRQLLPSLGACTLHLRLYELNGPGAKTLIEDGRFRLSWPTYYAVTREVMLSAGESLELDLESH